MNAKKRSVARVGLILSSALAVAATGCATHVHQRTVYVPAPPPVVVTPPPPVVVTPPPAPESPPPVVVVSSPEPAPVVVIQSDNDFYEPLSPYGRWVVVAGYGRCWAPARVEVGWRPYSDGYWQRTDAGWYWMSDEPWGWATYHYGRWDWQAEFGWIWVPQTQWAPAWVAWREGGGYVGWAPLRPSVTIGVSLTSVNYEPAFASRAFVFVEHRRMLEPVRPKTVIVNNTTVINQTVNITKVSVVNKTVINEGPRPEVIERESGRKINQVAAREFRHREETTAVGRERNIPANGGRNNQRPNRVEVEARSAPTGVPHKEQKVERVPTITRTIETAPQPVTPVAQPSLGRSKPNEVVRHDERKIETPPPMKGSGQIRETKDKPVTQAASPNPGRHTRTVEDHAEVITKPAKPSITAGQTRNEVRGNAKPERVSSVVPRPTQSAPAIVATSETKHENERPGKVEATPQSPKLSRPTGSMQSEAPQRTQMSPREKSRSAEQAEARPQDRGQGQEKKERRPDPDK